MNGRLAGKVAIVTGAGSVGPGIGNGRASAVVYAREGARVMLVDLNTESAGATEEMIRGEGGDYFTFRADVSDAEDCRRLVQECLSRYGRIDILHNNVGIEIPGGLADTTEHSGLHREYRLHGGGPAVQVQDGARQPG